MKQLCLVLSIALAGGSLAAQRARPSVQDLIRASIDAMGGEAALKAVRSVRIETTGHGYALEQSERPEGPYLVTYQQVSEIRDHERGRLWRKPQVRNWSAVNWSGPAGGMAYADGVVASNTGTRWVAAPARQLATMRDEMEMAPERMLFAILAAPDLAVAPDRELHGVRNRAVRFTRGTLKYTLYLNSHTNMPTMLQSVEDDSFGIWGDVTRERWFTWWALQPGGWYYPRQITTTWNGLPSTDMTVFSIAVDEPIDEALFAIPEDTRSAFRKALEAPAPAAGTMGLRGLKLDITKAIKVNDGLIILPGNWHVALVRQPDGIVVFEAPIGSHYSVQVIEAAAKLFPGVRVKAVVSTSDAWPHLAGVREYAARGIPIYALDLNLPIIRRLLASTQSAAPDLLSKNRRAAVLRPVSSRTTLGAGATRVDLMPVRGEGSERMMMAYLPALRMLYGSDLLQWSSPQRTSFFNLAYPAELAAAVKREDLGVDRAWAMHMDPIEWSKVAAALEANRAKK